MKNIKHLNEWDTFRSFILHPRHKLYNRIEPLCIHTLWLQGTLNHQIIKAWVYVINCEIGWRTCMVKDLSEHCCPLGSVTRKVQICILWGSITLFFNLPGEIETDYSLFRYVSGLTHVDYHNSTFVPLMNVMLPTLYPACNEVSQCLFDYEVSNDDTELAMATLGAFEAFESSSENIRKSEWMSFGIFKESSATAQRHKILAFK